MDRRELLAKYPVAYLVVTKHSAKGRSHWYGVQAVIDKRDFAWASPVEWRMRERRDGKVFAEGRLKGELITLHRAVALRHLGPRPSPNHVCEHLNGDLLDCQSENLKWSLRGETEFHKRKRHEEYEAELASLTDGL
jgi:hypothetical protein